jgi:hypothetical protein
MKMGTQVREFSSLGGAARPLGDSPHADVGGSCICDVLQVLDPLRESTRSVLLELDGSAGVVRPQALARGGGIIGWWRCSDD